MKTYLLTCFMLFGSTALFAQQPESVILVRNKAFKNMFYINPGPLFAGGFDLGFEHFSDQKHSLFGTIGYYTSKNAGALDMAKSDGYFENMEGLRVDLQYRIYRKPNHYRKTVYIGPFLTVKSISADDVTTRYDAISGRTVKTVESKHASAVAFGYIIGLKQSVFENLFLDLNLGGGITLPVSGNGAESVHIPTINPYQRSINPRFGFGFALAF